MFCAKSFVESIKILIFITLLAARAAFAQQPTQRQQPDVLIFVNGDRLVGHLERSAGSSVVFKSDMVGEISVDWSKIKELDSSNKYAVISKGVKLRHKESGSGIPQGDITMTNQQLKVTNEAKSTSQTVPVANAAYVVDENTFRKDLEHNPSLLADWSGAVTAGISLVQATQDSRSISAAVNLARTVPDQSWLDPRNKTLLDFTSSYGKVTQPSTPTVKTNIIHADLERDEYLTSRVYAFGVGDWDHNYSQGLDLQQSYGGGLGWTLLKTDTEELSVRAGMDYVRQEFTNSTSQNLIGSMFAESYNRDFPHSIVFTESIKIMPAWNDPNAYSVLGNATLALPVYKRFNLTLSAIDSFLNNPPPGFKKNSFQFITGLTYTVR
jgi:hypothetical protein